MKVFGGGGGTQSDTSALEAQQARTDARLKAQNNRVTKAERARRAVVARGGMDTAFRGRIGSGDRTGPAAVTGIA